MTSIDRGLGWALTACDLTEMPRSPPGGVSMTRGLRIAVLVPVLVLVLVAACAACIVVKGERSGTEVNRPASGAAGSQPDAARGEESAGARAPDELKAGAVQGSGLPTPVAEKP